MFAYENGAKTLLNARKNAAKRARLAQPNESTRHRTRASATQRCQTRETMKTRSTRERPNTSPHSAMQKLWRQRKRLPGVEPWSSCLGPWSLGQPSYDELLYR